MSLAGDANFPRTPLDSCSPGSNTSFFRLYNEGYCPGNGTVETLGCRAEKGYGGVGVSSVGDLERHGFYPRSGSEATCLQPDRGCLTPKVSTVPYLLWRSFVQVRTDAGISDAFDSSTLKAFRPVHSSKLHHLFLRLSLAPMLTARAELRTNARLDLAGSSVKIGGCIYD